MQNQQLQGGSRNKENNTKPSPRKKKRGDLAERPGLISHRWNRVEDIVQQLQDLGLSLSGETIEASTLNNEHGSSVALSKESFRSSAISQQTVSSAAHRKILKHAAGFKFSSHSTSS